MHLIHCSCAFRTNLHPNLVMTARPPVKEAARRINAGDWIAERHIYANWQLCGNRVIITILVNKLETAEWCSSAARWIFAISHWRTLFWLLVVHQSSKTDLHRCICQSCKQGFGEVADWFRRTIIESIMYVPVTCRFILQASKTN